MIDVGITGCYNTGVVKSRYRQNAGVVFSLKYHLVWCPKYRKPVLVDAVAESLVALIKLKAAELGATIHALEVMPDHVHLFVESDPTRAPTHIAAQFKGFTSNRLCKEFPHLRTRLPSLWSRSYYIGSLGEASASTIQHYIEAQRGR